jgi:hypothetical protein
MMKTPIPFLAVRSHTWRFRSMSSHRRDATVVLDVNRSGYLVVNNN